MRDVLFIGYMQTLSGKDCDCFALGGEPSSSLMAFNLSVLLLVALQSFLNVISIKGAL